MTAPSAALAADLAAISGDLIILGIGGKIGPTLARLAKRAAPGKRVVGVARFSEKGLREQLDAWGIECIEADLLDGVRSRRCRNCQMSYSWLAANLAPPGARTSPGR